MNKRIQKSQKRNKQTHKVVEKLYKPPRVLVTPEAKDNPFAMEILQRAKDYNPNLEVIFTKNQMPKLPDGLTDHEKFAYLKDSPMLCTRSKTASYIETFASPGNIVENMGAMAKIAFHCPMKCQFCYLNISGRSTPWTRMYVSLDRLKGEMVKERLVHKIALTIWTILSYSKGISISKVPPKFKDLIDKRVRKDVLSPRKSISTDVDALKYLEKNLESFLNFLGIKFSQNIPQKVRELLSGYWEENSKLPLWINIGEYTDILCIDHITGYMDQILQWIEEDPELRIQFRTTGTYIDNLLKHNGHGRVRITFNLNTDFAINKYEHGPAMLDEKFEAIKKLLAHGGYDIRIAIEPIIKYDGYEKDYAELIRRIKNEIGLDKVTNIKIGTIRFKTVLKNYIIRLFPDSGLFDDMSLYNAPEPGDKRWRYTDDERVAIYKMLIDEIGNQDNISIGLGSEQPRIWDKVGLDTKMPHAGIVHQFTKAEPGKPLKAHKRKKNVQKKLNK